jgi:hypothetical protein
MMTTFRYFSEDPEYTQISAKDKAVRDRMVAIMARYTREMEGYSYFGSNPGISADDYEEVADEIMQEMMGAMGWQDVTKVVPQDYEQVLVTDGTEYRVLHREEGSWAFEVAPCDRTAMKYWKKLVD